MPGMLNNEGDKKIAELVQSSFNSTNPIAALCGSNFTLSESLDFSDVGLLATNVASRPLVGSWTGPTSESDGAGGTRYRIDSGTVDFGAVNEGEGGGGTPTTATAYGVILADTSTSKILYVWKFSTPISVTLGTPCQYSFSLNVNKA
jgi:hypothetical protein